jgi:hypothetical protein
VRLGYRTLCSTLLGVYLHIRLHLPDPFSSNKSNICHVIRLFLLHACERFYNLREPVQPSSLLGVVKVEGIPIHNLLSYCMIIRLNGFSATAQYSWIVKSPLYAVHIHSIK